MPRHPLPSSSARPDLTLHDLVLLLRDGHGPLTFVAGHMLLLLQPLCLVLNLPLDSRWIQALLAYGVSKTGPDRASRTS